MHHITPIGLVKQLFLNLFFLSFANAFLMLSFLVWFIRRYSFISERREHCGFVFFNLLHFPALSSFLTFYFDGDNFYLYL